MLFVLMLTLAGCGLLLYVAMWILVPLDSDAYHLPLSSHP
jgi:phage shock protein PspC (stress-responsive transcriptional regulator)